MSKLVVILGAGPSGMMAAHAASQCGYEVKIYDKDPNFQSKTSGLFYLHDSCSLLIDCKTISQTILGAYRLTDEEIIRQYGEKVYGKNIEGLSILDAKQHGVILAYNAQQAIERLWDLYGHLVSKYDVKSLLQVEKDLAPECGMKIISTIPVNFLFPNIDCQYETAWCRMAEAPKDDAFIFYSISPNHLWYRASAMFGIFVQEFPSSAPIVLRSDESREGYTIFGIQKVIGKVKLPKSKKVLFAGRYGAWDKTQLVHNVYERVIGWLSKDGV